MTLLCVCVCVRVLTPESPSLATGRKTLMAESKGFEEEARSLLKIAELSATSVPCSCDPLPLQSTSLGLAMPGHSPTDSRLSRDAIAGISARA